MRYTTLTATMLALLLCSCAKKDVAAVPDPNATAIAATPGTSGSPHVTVRLRSGKTVGGTIVASTTTDMTVLDDQGIETRIPMDQVASVDYGAARPTQTNSQQRQLTSSNSGNSGNSGNPSLTPSSSGNSQPPAPRRITSRTLELPVGSLISVRLNETIDSKTAREGQTYAAEITRDAVDADGDIVIPRQSLATVVIKSASKGNRFIGASDLVVDMTTVTVDGRRYNIETAAIREKGKDGIGANKRTAKFTGAGAAIGAVIGAIAGGGKGAAIGAGAGAGAGAIGQVATKGGSIRIPVETVLTFHLDQPLRVADGN